jgi:hemolysin activation/secretion protein
MVIGEKLKNKYLFSVLCSFSVVAVGQAVPEAGSLQQQLDKERRIELPKLQPQAPTVIPAPLKAQGELVVEAREFRFAGNTLVDKKILSQVLATYLERPLNLQELQTAASLVAQTYRNQGWIARAYLPEQDIEQGVITIQIVEAIFGGIEIDEANKPILVGTAQIQALFDAQLQPGEKLSQHRLERALLLSDDLQGISVNGALAEGNANGQTVMKIKMTNSPFISGDVTADNTESPRVSWRPVGLS